MRVAVAWGRECRATHEEIEYLQRNRELKRLIPIKMVLHALDATSNGDTELLIHSPDIDFPFLSLRRYPALYVKTSFVTGTG